MLCAAGVCGTKVIGAIDWDGRLISGIFTYALDRNRLMPFVGAEKDLPNLDQCEH
jgi:hypothetical protein